MTNSSILSAPQASGDTQHSPNTTLISVLLSNSLSWSWLLSNSDASAQVFAYMPELLADALKINHSEVMTSSLEAYEPPGWTGNGHDVYVS